MISKIQSSYKKAPYFDLIFPIIEELFAEKPRLLADFNTALIKKIVQLVGIETEILSASELPLANPEGSGSELLLDIVQCLDGDLYISGSGGHGYLNVDLFYQNDIDVYFQEFKHPTYKQANSKKFVEYLSTVDLLFNYGENAMEVVRKNNVQKSELTAKRLQLELS